MSDQERCPKCGKVLYPDFPVDLADLDKFCSGHLTPSLHGTSLISMPLPSIAVCATLIDSDLDKIRAIVREELDRKPDGNALKHDGNLDGRNPYQVKILFQSYFQYSCVRIGHEGTEDDSVWLAPKQALSLLRWLQQEEETLQRLAKEQEG